MSSQLVIDLNSNLSPATVDTILSLIKSNSESFKTLGVSLWEPVYKTKLPEKQMKWHKHPYNLICVFSATYTDGKKILYIHYELRQPTEGYSYQQDFASRAITVKDSENAFDITMDLLEKAKAIWDESEHWGDVAGSLTHYQIPLDMLP